MGMFDYIECDYELPGIKPDYFDKLKQFVFQTKDLDCTMDTYLIDADGVLSIHDFTGEINFYDSNIVGYGPAIYTRNGEDAESVDYVAEFIDSKLKEIKQTTYKREAAFPSSKHIFTEKSSFDLSYNEEEDLTGQRIYVLYGGSDEGYWGTVIYDSDTNEVCIELDEVRYGKRLEILNKVSRNGTFWTDAELAHKVKQEKADNWNNRLKEFEKYKEEWKKNQ